MPANSKPEINLWQSAEIKLALQDQIISFGKIDLPVNQVVIDSRSKTDNGLFVAFKGEFNDGHNYLQNAFENGCKLAIVDRIPEKFKNDKRLILVKNSLDALDSLAIFARNRTKAKIIAVTGSVGKTSVKEMLKIIFKTQGRTFGTIGNLNNNFGLPLSLCNMPQDCKFGIFEIGMSHFGEIEKLSKIARPHIAIITNVMAAHIGNFKNEEEIALAKSEIFAGLEENGFALINADNIHNEFIRKQALSRKILTKNIVSFSANEASNIKIIGIHDSGNFHSTVEVLLSSSNKKISYQINSINQATIFNSLIAVGCLELIGTNSSDG
ncbi:MAG: UDP-N-acetylmuramoyl-tripeptide--D-alanyl-D-alanine ligase, partial [Rickettsiales bacterium]